MVATVTSCAQVWQCCFKNVLIQRRLLYSFEQGNTKAENYGQVDLDSSRRGAEVRIIPTPFILLIKHTTKYVISLSKFIHGDFAISTVPLRSIGFLILAALVPMMVPVMFIHSDIPKLYTKARTRPFHITSEDSKKVTLL